MYPTLERISSLSRAATRGAAAKELARHLGADWLLLFIRDDMLQAFLPAPGMPQTIPGGPTWAELFRRCRTPGRHHLQVCYPDRATLRDAVAIATEDGLVFALVGGQVGELEHPPLCLPLLAALLRAELETKAALGKEQAAREEVRHAVTLTTVLDLTRADLERSLGETRRLNAELESAARRKDEFLAMLAHELRNPLSPIVSGIDILRRQGPEEAKSPRILEVMERQAHHLTRLVDDLLDVSRISRGLIQLRQETVPLASALHLAVESVRPLVESERHTLSLTMPAEPIWVSGDPVRLTQIFGNLLTNAAKYTQPGGRIEVTVQREGERVAVRVRDTGVGIEQEMLPKVFDLFTQAPRSLDRAKGGLGIGLTLVSRLVGLHGGVIDAVSDGIGKGSAFTVRLPLAPPPRTLPDPEREAVRPAAQRVLVVEDNVDAAELLAEALRMSGCTVRIANDGESGLAAALEFLPDLVLLDIGLPRTDGYAVARALRQRLPGTRMVALSGYGGEDFRARSREAGFDAHLVKPVELDELLKLVRASAAR